VPKDSELAPFRSVSIKSVGNQVIEHIENAKKKARLTVDLEPATQHGRESVSQAEQSSTPAANEESASQPEQSSTPASLLQAEHLSSPSSGDEHVSPDSVWIETEIVVSSVTEALHSTHEQFKSAVEKSSKHPETIGHRLLSYRARRAKAAMGTKLIKTVQSESVRKLKAALRSASKRTKPRGSPTEHIQQKWQIAAVSVSEEEQESPPARPNKKTKYCCFVKCPNTTLDKSLTFTSVPTQLPPTRTHKLGMKQRELFWIRKRRFMRSETL
jgi:hypothetical protein